MPPPSLQRLFSDSAALPAMPEVARRLLGTFRRDTVTLPELAALIGTDPALSARLLRIANSARYGPSGDIVRLQDAAAMIGLDALRGLALGASLASAFPKRANFDRLQFWHKSLVTAGYAAWLADELGADADSAETAGLLLRTGRLLMLQAEPALTTLVQDLASGPDGSFAAERQHFGCTHAELSAELAKRWRLPPVITLTLRSVSDPLSDLPQLPLGALVRVASVLAEAACDGLDPATELAARQGPLCEALDLPPALLALDLPNWRPFVAMAADMLD